MVGPEIVGCRQGRRRYHGVSASLLDDGELFAHALQDHQRRFEFGALVRGRDDGAKPRFAFRHRGIANGWGK